MKQLSKLESAIFLLGGVLMVVGAACSHISMTATRRCRSMAEVQRCFLPASQSHGLSMKGCRSTVRTRKLPMTMWTWMFPALLCPSGWVQTMAG